MKLTEIIQHGHQIIEGVPQLFIADKDFYFNGLPILKNSLVHYSGETISVNKISTVNHLDQSNRELWNLNEGLTTDEDGLFYILEPANDCENESKELSTGAIGFWHKTHFDEVRVLWQYLNSRLQQNEPTLIFKGIEFSSICYTYDFANDCFIYFINTSPVKIPINYISIDLPKYLEISRDENSYTIVPITGMVYHGIYFDSGEGLTLHNDGILAGNIGKGFKAEVLNLVTKKIEVIDLTNDRLYLSITPEGSKFTRLFYPEIQERQECQILKIL